MTRFPAVTGEGLSHGILVAGAVAVLALSVGGCGASDEPVVPAEPTAVVSSTSGAFSLTTFPGDSQAGLRFADFVAEGDVVIENEGKRPSRFSLRQEIEYEHPAAGDRQASQAVGLRIVDTTGKGAERELYRGPVAGLDTVPVGEIPPGSSREYAFKLTPRTPLRPSSLDLTYRWVSGDPAPPRLGVALRIPPEQPVLDTRTIVAFARCTRPCELEGRAVLRASSRQPIDLSVRAERSSSERAARLVLSVSGKAFPVIREALTRGPPESVALRVSASDGDGGSALATEPIRLKPISDRR